MGEIIVEEYHVEWDDEDRIKVIGRVRNIPAVIYTERDEKYRIISARKATKKEEAKYYGQYSYL